MLFGASMYKINLLHAQKMSNSVNLRLNKAQKNVTQVQKQIKNERNVLNNNWLNGKEAWIQSYMIDNGLIEDGGEATAEDQQINYQAYNKAAAAWSVANSDYQTYLDNVYDENSNTLIEAANQEEEELQIEADFWKNMVTYWEQMVKTAEEWFKQSLDLIFGGGGRR